MYKHISFIALLVCLIFPIAISAQTKVGTVNLGYRETSISAYANAMGGCNINQVSPESQFSNPGAMGLFHLRNRISLTIPNNTDAGIFDIRTYNVNIRLLPIPKFASGEKKPKNTIGIGYSYSRYTPEEILYTSYQYPFGRDYYTKYFSSLTCYGSTLGLGLRFKSIEMGFGYTLKYLEQKYQYEIATGLAHDIGMIISFTNSPTNLDDFSPNSEFQITPQIAFTVTNIGSSIKSDETKYSIPKWYHIGASCNMAFTLDAIGEIFFTPCFQLDLPAEDKYDQIKRAGLEIGLGNVLFLRGGLVDLGNSAFVDNNRETFGFGFSSQGLFKVDHNNSNQNETMRFLRNIDLRFDFARAPGAYFGMTNYFKLSLTF